MKRILAIALLFLPSCASIMAPGPDMVPVTTQPEGARVTLDGDAVGVTPLTVAFKRKGEGVLVFALDGYKTTTYDVEKVTNGWQWGNVLFGFVGIVGLLVDAASYNTTKYPEAAIIVPLEKGVGEATYTPPKRKKSKQSQIGYDK